MSQSRLPQASCSVFSSVGLRARMSYWAASALRRAFCSESVSVTVMRRRISSFEGRSLYGRGFGIAQDWMALSVRGLQHGKRITYKLVWELSCQDVVERDNTVSKLV